MTQRVLVVGAGIAGPALAYWMHRYGYEVSVLERGPVLRTDGYKVDIRGAAMDAVERMGLKEELERHETDMRYLSFVDTAGRKLATVPAALFMGRGDVDLEVMRGDLSRVLYDATRTRVDYRFDDTVTELTQNDHAVDVVFQRAAPETFDLVLGADGLHSVVRRLAFGAEPDLVRDLGHQVAIGSVRTT